MLIMGQRLDFIYYKDITAATEFSGPTNTYSATLEMNTIPLKYRIKEFTVILENEVAWTEELLSLIGFSDVDPDDLYVHENADFYTFKNAITVSDSAFSYLLSDTTPFHLFIQEKDINEWNAWTQHIDAYHDGSRSPLHLAIALASLSGTNQAVGTIGMYLLLGVEIL